MSEEATRIGNALGRQLEVLGSQVSAIGDKALDLGIAMGVFALGFKVGSFDVAIREALRDPEKAETLREVIGTAPADDATETD